MRHAIIVTSTASEENIHSFENFPILVFEEVQNLVENLQHVEVYKDDDIKSAVDATLMMPKVEKSFIEKLISAIEFLWHKGYDELTILCDVHTSISAFFQISTIFNQFPRLKIDICDGKENISLFRVGTYILTKKHYSSMDVYPFPYAKISIEHALEKYTHVELGNSKPYLTNVRFLDRLCVLRIEEGNAIIVLKEATSNA